MAAQIIQFPLLRRQCAKAADPNGYYDWRFRYDRPWPGEWERFKSGHSDPMLLAAFEAIERRHGYRRESAAGASASPGEPLAAGN